MKTLGILGGMGPMATVDFFNKVVNKTDAHSDAEHIHILIDNYSQIPDRTAFILNEGQSPVKALVEAAMRLQMMGAEVITMPCNTAHYFYDDINRFLDIPVLNMIEETAKHLKATRPNMKRVGLMATTGTYEGHVYDQVFKKYGLEVVFPTDSIKETIMNIIYGIKEGHMDQRDLMLEVINYFDSMGVNQLILGCTELPVAVTYSKIEGNFVDPTAVLAEAAICFVGGTVKS